MGTSTKRPEPFWRSTPFKMAAPPVAFVAIVTVVGCVSSSSTGGTASQASSSAAESAFGSPSASPSASDIGSPSPSAPAAPTMTRQTDKVVFRVSGSGYPSVQYGSDSDSNNVPGGYGPLGDGVALPWSASLTYDPNALYYAVSAQLEGSGDISDSVTEVITTYCSDGSHKTESFALARARERRLCHSPGRVCGRRHWQRLAG